MRDKANAKKIVIEDTEIQYGADKEVAKINGIDTDGKENILIPGEKSGQYDTYRALNSKGDASM
jgi:hypothetical protein